MSLKSPKSDSLDLLLGPMCNTFGVLVLIACITALFTEQSADNKPARKITAREELLQRRLNSAQGERDKLTALIGDGAVGLSPEVAAKLMEIERLRQVLAALQLQTKDLDRKISDSAAKSVVDPGASIGELKLQQRTSQREIEGLKNMIAALEEQMAHLEKRKQDLLKDRNKVVESRTVKMRFPREHESDLRPLQVIVRYGKVYPLRLANESRNPAIEFTSEGADGYAAEPIPSGGWTPKNDGAKIREFITSIKGSEFYFSILVYPDSFEACRGFKQMILDSGMQFGLKALPENFPLAFSKKGMPPPKPL